MKRILAAIMVAVLASVTLALPASAEHPPSTSCYMVNELASRTYDVGGGNFITVDVKVPVEKCYTAVPQHKTPQEQCEDAGWVYAYVYRNEDVYLFKATPVKYLADRYGETRSCGVRPPRLVLT